MNWKHCLPSYWLFNYSSNLRQGRYADTFCICNQAVIVVSLWYEQLETGSISHTNTCFIAKKSGNDNESIEKEPAYTSPPTTGNPAAKHFFTEMGSQRGSLTESKKSVWLNTEIFKLLWL